MNKKLLKPTMVILLYAIFPIAYMLLYKYLSNVLENIYSAANYSYDWWSMLIHLLLILVNGFLVLFLYSIFTNKIMGNKSAEKVGILMGVLYCVLLILPIPAIKGLLTVPLISEIYVSLFSGIILPSIFIFSYLLKFILISKDKVE